MFSALRASGARSAMRAARSRVHALRSARALSGVAPAAGVAMLTSRHVPRATTWSAMASVSRVPMRLYSSADLPEHIRLDMPALSPTMTTGTLGEWEMSVGDEVAAGDLLISVETDKATIDYEATEDGFIAAILVPSGSKDVPVGKLLAIMVEDEEDVAAFANFTDSGNAEAPAAAAPAAAAPEAPAAAAAAPAATGGAGGATATGAGVPSSPYAKTLAREHGVDLNQIQGTGMNNRIVGADVQDFVAAGGATAQPAAAATATATPAAAPAPAPAPPAAAPGDAFTDIPNSNMRRVIAERLLESKRTIPHYYLSQDVNIDKLLAVRKELNAVSETKISVNDFVIKASAYALRKVPEVNSSWHGEFVRQYDYVDISVAVSTDAGLITPIVADADVKGVEAISTNMKELAGKARSNKLLPEEFQGGTFTISNLGMFGISSFSAVINPPQSCILAVGGGEQRVVAVEKATGEVSTPTSTELTDTHNLELATYMNVTLSCDHRVVDGAVGARWLQEFKKAVENPTLMLL